MKELDNFLKELKGDKNNKSIILFGSHARGNPRENSDIDLIVVCNETKRGVEKRNGQIFEIVYVTEDDAKSFYEKNKDNAVRTWDVAKILFDGDGSAERLKEFVANIKSKGKEEIDGNKLEHLVFDIEDFIRAIEQKKEEDITNVHYLLNEKIQGLLELFFNIRGLWLPAPKQLLERIKQEDSELYNLLAKYYGASSVDEKIEIMKDVIRRVFL